MPILVLACATTAGAQSSESESKSVDSTDPGSRPTGVVQPGVGGNKPTEMDTLLRDPAGLRSAAEERGLRIDGFAIGDYSLLLAGGAQPRDIAARFVLQAGIALDTETVFGLPGGTLRAAYLGFHGDNGNRASGDAQVYSNIDARPFDALYSLWYRQVFIKQALAVKIGKMDTNADFGFVENGIEFLNSSAGYSPTILGIPSYPNPATGAAVFVETPFGIYLRGGVYDGATLAGPRTGTRAPDDFMFDSNPLFSIGEAGFSYQRAGLSGRIAGGYWRHSATLERFDGTRQGHAEGLYAVWDQSLYNAEGSPLSIEGFAQFGEADEQVSEIETYIGVGLTAAALFTNRQADVTGLMVSRVDFSDAPAAGFIDAHETAYELFHEFRPTPWLSLQPDFQYIVNPGGMGLDDARVLTVRSEIIF